MPDVFGYCCDLILKGLKVDGRFWPVNSGDLEKNLFRLPGI